MELQTIFVLLPLIIFLPFCCSSSTDTIRFNESLADGQVLISSGKKYTLGFFSPGKSTNRYVGIWFTKLPTQEVVWVANRDDPINDTSSSLSIDPRGGGLVLNQRINGTAATLWSINVSTGENPVVARLLDEGNFVLLRQDGDRETVVLWEGVQEAVLWQSFANPTDSYLPYTVRKTGPDYAIRSWKSPDDPATGDWSYFLDPSGSPQLTVYRGRTKQWRSGPWNGIGWSGIPDLARVSVFFFTVEIDENDTTIIWGLRDPAMISRVYLDPAGTLSRGVWLDEEGRWDEVFRYPTEFCDVFGNCGPNGLCDPYRAVGEFPCICLPGFEPRSPIDWSLRNALGGCVRKRARNLSCGGDGGGGDGFVKLKNAKVPDTTTAVRIAGVDLSGCAGECLRNCSCTAYASSNLTSGIGCILLFGDLVDTRLIKGAGQDLYVLADAIELAEYRKRLRGYEEKKKKMLAIGLTFVGAAIILGVSAVYYCLLKRKRKEENLYEDKDSSVPIFDVLDIFAATENFSDANKLGQGGFGLVYKGTLSSGQEIAVKRLSQTSRQGIREFKNEVRLVSKLQHKNLARIFGCCIHGEDKMLVYEYLPNRSLDFFIFDKTKGLLLGWMRRFEIIIGVARGLLYLHQDSRLKIIHRDLKASNVLLDATMNPKISDFGLAKLFGEDQIEANTDRVVGTYGYMSPEYAMEGLYSTKSDVFSFGVLTLEIVSSTRSNQCYQGSSSSSLIGHVWDLWSEGRALDMVDSSTMGESFSTEQVMRCIQIGLLCVQEFPTDRPAMSDVVFMLGNATTLPSPKKPAFVLNKKYDDADPATSSATGSSGVPSVNRVSITTLVAR
ncbi:unnamed protein product [Linum tenue]|uniref:Receptor-like serine/threonine-protein kinase n=1 Tax=Linum tenue TaxID=586396 RepID=A0AAV0LAP5_9ROSI|nr:unnamed protein product [Linum tenue]